MTAVHGSDASIGELNPTVFMRKLMLELALGDVRLPSFPDIAARVQKVLEDPKATSARVAVVVRSEAALAARILRLANSSLLNISGEPINDLRVALTRLGVQLVRCTAVSFALQQMQLGGSDRALRSQLHELWRDGTLVASIAYVLARETKVANPDEALLTGLMHNIGRLYIAVNVPRGAQAIANSEEWTTTVNEWHPQIAVAILKHWKFPASIATAVANQTSQDRETDEKLSDILITAILLVPCIFKREALSEIAAEAPALQRLKLNAADCNRILVASAEQIRSLRAGLSD